VFYVLNQHQGTMYDETPFKIIWHYKDADPQTRTVAEVPERVYKECLDNYHNLFYFMSQHTSSPEAAPRSLQDFKNLPHKISEWYRNRTLLQSSVLKVISVPIKKSPHRF
jgi:hypothetical protein